MIRKFSSSSPIITEEDLLLNKLTNSTTTEDTGDVDSLILEGRYDVKNKQATVTSTLLASRSPSGDSGLPEHSDMDKLTELLEAVKLGDGGRVRDLLKQKNGYLHDNQESQTVELNPLLTACEQGYPDIVRALIEHGTDINLTDAKGCTALHKAASYGHLDVVDLLIDSGSNVNIQEDMYGNTPLHEASWHGFSKTVELFLKNQSNPLLANRAGCTALHLSAQNGHNQTSRHLIYSGCPPDLANNYGDTPLHTATRYGHAGVCRILISAKCNISAQNKNGDTCLHISAAFKRRKITKLLVERGVASELTNNQAETAMMIASRKGHDEINEIIVNTKAIQNRPSRHTPHHHSPAMLSSPAQSGGNSSHDNTTPKIQEEKKKGFKNWIKKKFKNSSTPPNNHNHNNANGGVLGAQGSHHKNNSPNYQYYRDLAGNIKQSNVTASPNNCQCGHGVVVSPYQNAPYHNQLYQQIPVQNYTFLDSLHAQQQQHMNPFAATPARQQARFNDDFQRDQMMRERLQRQQNFPNAQLMQQGRLFRSRSDETLNQSEYSYHGNAYKSKQAAILELKNTQIAHEQMRKTRNMIRYGVDGQVTNPIDHSDKTTAANIRRSNSAKVPGSQSHHTTHQHNQSNHTGQQINQSNTPEKHHSHPSHHRSIPSLWKSADIAKSGDTNQSQEKTKPVVQSNHVRSTSQPHMSNPTSPADHNHHFKSTQHELANGFDLSPLKSAMRHPEETTKGPKQRLGSNSSAKKQVRYDDTVKPPSSKLEPSPDEVRHAPVGAQDSTDSFRDAPSAKVPPAPPNRKISLPPYTPKPAAQNGKNPPAAATYQRISTALNTRDNLYKSSEDIRENIVNARQELQSQKHQRTRHRENGGTSRPAGIQPPPRYSNGSHAGNQNQPQQAATKPSRPENSSNGRHSKPVPFVSYHTQAQLARKELYESQTKVAQDARPTPRPKLPSYEELITRGRVIKPQRPQNGNSQGEKTPEYGNFYSNKVKDSLKKVLEIDDVFVSTNRTGNKRPVFTDLVTDV